MTDKKQKKKNSMTVAAILIVSFLPIAAAYTMFYTGIGVPNNTVNKGILLPIAVSTEKIFEVDFFKEIEADKKWRLVLPVNDNCNQACQENLYITRQVHIRLGEKGTRIERIAVNIGGQTGKNYLASIEQEHPKLKQVSVDKDKWQQWLEESKVDLDFSAEPYYLLLDQQGYAMMYYTNAQHGNDLLKDLKRALKHSIDYQS